MSAEQRGSAPVEFALVAVLVLTLVLAVLQLGLALHVRNTIETAASDGARYGARAGRGPDSAAARTRTLISRGLAPRFADDVTATDSTTDGLPTVEVDVRTELPVLGPWGPSGALHVRAHALAEDP